MGLPDGAATWICPDAQIFTSANGGLPFSWTDVFGMVAKNVVTFQKRGGRFGKPKLNETWRGIKGQKRL
jgi:hypothetical protein